MPLFDTDKIVVTKNVNGIEFNLFKNTMELFNLYEQRDGHFFTSNFEYVNKINLNPKYDVLYLNVDGIIYLFIYEIQKDNFVAYNVESYLYALKNGINVNGIKYCIANEKRVEISRNSGEYVDAIYIPKGLAYMEGKNYSRIRGNRNNFLHHIDESRLSFIHYNRTMKQSVLNLYDSWKKMSKENGNTFIVDAKIFKDGLENKYIEKFVLLYDGKLLGFISILIKNDWCYIYSMKSTRDYPNQNTYMINQMWKYICENHKDVKWINLGGIDNIESKGTDYKMLLKPDHLIRYYSNIEVK